MEHPASAGHPGGGIEGGPQHLHPIQPFPPPGRVAVCGRHPPGRIVGRRGKDGDRMPPGPQPGAQLPGITPDPDKLRSIIDAVNQDTQRHRFILPGSGP